MDPSSHTWTIVKIGGGVKEIEIKKGRYHGAGTHNAI